MGIGGILLTVVALGMIVSTAETRAAGKAMFKPYGRICAAFVLLFWGAVFLLG